MYQMFVDREVEIDGVTLLVSYDVEHEVPDPYADNDVDYYGYTEVSVYLIRDSDYNPIKTDVGVMYLNIESETIDDLYEEVKQVIYSDKQYYLADYY